MAKNELLKTRCFGPLTFSLLALLVGVVASVGAVIFRGLIAFFHNLLFLGVLSLDYDATAHTPASPWGPFVILVPVLGALAVVFLVANFAPEAKGHGVPEVMDAIYYSKGRVRPVVALIKSLASALCIGSGGSVGREGPIIQIGSSFGSTLGQLIAMPAWQRITLIAAGAGAGIAATFNTPVGGVLFAIEILLPEVTVRTLVPVAISTATATYIGRLVFGANPSFLIPEFEKPYFHVTQPELLPVYIGLGLLTGIVSAAFIRSIYACEDWFEKQVRGNYYLRHAGAMLLVGLAMYVLLIGTGHYYVQGIGYATIQDILSGRLAEFWLLLLLVAAKLLATSLTLGSGGSGGIFSPALFLGATAGAAYATLVQYLFPGLDISPRAFAVVGMAGVVGGATGAAMTAIVMIFEMTLNYHVIIPMTVTVALSHGIRFALCSDTIYTLKLTRRGHHMPAGLQTNFEELRRAHEIMDTHLLELPATDTLDQAAHLLAERSDVSCFLVKNGKGLIGFLTRESVLGALGRLGKETTLEQIADKSLVMVPESATLLEVLSKMRQAGAAAALVGQDAAAGPAVAGFISKQTVADAMAVALELFSG